MDDKKTPRKVSKASSIGGFIFIGLIVAAGIYALRK